MLKASDGLPAEETPDGYPFEIAWSGILVDDPSHPDDILKRLRDVLEVGWKDRADPIELEICQTLVIKEFREYFRRSGKGGFWDDHVSRYSKSRRKAPIYWLLQSSKKNYALWLYYHRLDKDILFQGSHITLKTKITLRRGPPLYAPRSEEGGQGAGKGTAVEEALRRRLSSRRSSSPNCATSPRSSAEPPASTSATPKNSTRESPTTPT